MLLPALSPLPLARAAAQDKVAAPPVKAPAPPLPQECTGLPLPSSLAFEKSRYEARLGSFLRSECYRQPLGWQHDAQLRTTGPTIATLDATKDPHLPSWKTTGLGTHGTVVIYYSPDVYRWLCEGDAARERRFVKPCTATCPQCRLDAGQLASRPRKPIADGSMIVKEMYGDPTAEDLENPAVPHQDADLHRPHGQGRPRHQGRLVLGLLGPRET